MSPYGSYRAVASRMVWDAISFSVTSHTTTTRSSSCPPRCHEAKRPVGGEFATGFWDQQEPLCRDAVRAWIPGNHERREGSRGKEPRWGVRSTLVRSLLLTDTIYHLPRRTHTAIVMLDSTVPTQHGDLSIRPLRWSGEGGDLPGTGVLNLPWIVPSSAEPGDEFPFQALVGARAGELTRLTNLLGPVVE